MNNIFNFISLTFPLFFFIFFIVIIYTIFYNLKRRKIEHILLDSKYLSKYNSYSILMYIIIIPFILSGAAFFVGGLSSITTDPTGIFFSIFGLLFLIIPIVILITTFNNKRKLRNGEYVIIKDTLKDKDIHTSSDSDGDTTYYYYFYFENYFLRYNDRVSVNSRDYYNANIGDEYYLLFMKNSHTPLVFKCSLTTIGDDIKDKLTTIDNLSSTTNIKEYKVKANTENIIINKAKIFKDSNNIFIGLLLFIIGTIAFIFTNYFINISVFLPAFILVSMICYILLAIGSVILIKNLKLYLNIKNDNFTIKKDLITGINKNIDYRLINYKTSFELENEIDTLIGNKKYFTDIKEGDYLYIIYIDGYTNNKPIYNVRYSTISDEVRDRLR